MFYFYAIGSMLAYSVQQTLLVHHARKIDGLSLAFYRNISFALTLSPLLLGATTSDFLIIASHWQMLLLSGLCGATYLGLLFASYRYLTVGVGNSVSKALATMFVTAFGWIFFGETLSLFGSIALGLILLGTILLGIQHKHLPHLDTRFAKGILFVVIGALPVAFLMYVLTSLSREVSPLVAGYFWEVSIGVSGFILLFARSLMFGKHLQFIDGKSFRTIALCSAPTLIGTGFMAMALRTGPLGITNAIGCGLLVVSALLARLWYNEKLDYWQSASMALIIVGIVALKFV